MVSGEELKGREREHYILQLLEEGWDKEEIVIELGYKNKKSLHSFMARRGYRWSEEKGTYVKKTGETRTGNEGKADRVITLLKKGMDIKEVASTLKFSDYREMGSYMEGKGYRWNSGVGNYVRDDTMGKEEASGAEKTAPEGEGNGETTANSGEMVSHQEAVQWLAQNIDRLQQLLDADLGPAKIPRYMVGGFCITKSVHMSHKVDQLVKDFSEEKNITQREVYEVALIEFLRKYGFGEEVAALLKE